MDESAELELLDKVDESFTKQNDKSMSFEKPKDWGGMQEGEKTTLRNYVQFVKSNKLKLDSVKTPRTEYVPPK